MTLAVGTTLGQYQIVSLLGKGGRGEVLGEVYRARDTKLKREVAIRVLPADVASDRDRIGRLQREAEIIAALNHSNIASIYDVSGAAGTEFLVLELVDGDTLAELVARGPLPAGQALSIARQIGEGLEAAHDKGIIHRDLKPANVKITPGGQVKLLDFGLARELAAPPSVDVSDL